MGDKPTIHLHYYVLQCPQMGSLCPSLENWNSCFIIWIAGFNAGPSADRRCAKILFMLFFSTKWYERREWWPMLKIDLLGLSFKGIIVLFCCKFFFISCEKFYLVG